MAGKSAGAFRTISEVAKELDVQQHVLRFWESKFTQVKPLKRGGGRRYYRPDDVVLLQHIHNLLYKQGYTIKGVQKLLKGQSKGQIAANVNENGLGATAQNTQNVTPIANAGNAAIDVAVQSDNITALKQHNQKALKSMLDDLKDIRKLLNKAG